MKTITATSQKGGEAKTTTNLALGFGLANRGYKVLFIDLDPQQNLSKTIKADMGPDALTSFEVLTEACDINDAIQQVDNYWAIPSSKEQGIFGSGGIKPGMDLILRTAIQSLSPSLFDFVVLDTPPTLGWLTINATTACDFIVIPAQADDYSMDGITDLAETVDAIRSRTNPDLSIAGILLTRFNSRTNISQIFYEKAQDIAEEIHSRVFETTIREATVIREANAVKQDIFSYAARSKVANDYNAFVDEFLKVIE